MKLGFIGTGKITSSVVTGICKSKIYFQKILLSPRNRNVAKRLKREFKRVSIANNNQEIVNSCNWIFLAITPTVGQKIIKNLKFKAGQTIVSFISTMTLPQLKKAIKVKATIVRAIPSTDTAIINHHIETLIIMNSSRNRTNLLAWSTLTMHT